MNPENIKVLFLAKYAPTTVDEKIPNDIIDKSYAEYHHMIFNILIELFPSLISTNDSDYIMKNKPDVDFIFSLLNRMPFRNSEIFISAVAEYYSLPYLGARPNIRALAEDKHLAKMMACYANVPTPKWKVYDVGQVIIAPDFKPPYFVKPRFGAASEGIDERSICSSWDEAQYKIQVLHKNNIDALLEEQIIGVYHTNPVLNNFGNPLLLPCISQHSNKIGGVVTYKQKRSIIGGLNRLIQNDKQIEQEIHHYSKTMLELIQPLDYTRFDYIVDNEKRIPYFLEFNVCCNLGHKSTINQAAKHIGINYKNLIESITYSSMYRNGIIKSDFGKKL